MLAELDYLIATRVSSQAARALLQQVADGVYRLEPMSAEDIAAAVAFRDRYRTWPSDWPTRRSSPSPSATASPTC